MTEAQAIHEGWKLWDREPAIWMHDRWFADSIGNSLDALQRQIREDLDNYDPEEECRNLRWVDGKAYIDWGKAYTGCWKALHNA